MSHLFRPSTEAARSTEAALSREAENTVKIDNLDSKNAVIRLDTIAAIVTRKNRSIWLENIGSLAIQIMNYLRPPYPTNTRNPTLRAPLKKLLYSIIVDTYAFLHSQPNQKYWGYDNPSQKWFVNLTVQYRSEIKKLFNKPPEKFKDKTTLAVCPHSNCTELLEYNFRSDAEDTIEKYDRTKMYAYINTLLGSRIREDADSTNPITFITINDNDYNSGDTNYDILREWMTVLVFFDKKPTKYDQFTYGSKKVTRRYLSGRRPSYGPSIDDLDVKDNMGHDMKDEDPALQGSKGGAKKSQKRRKATKRRKFTKRRKLTKK